MKGCFHGAIENPVNGVSQLANHLFDQHLPELHLVDEKRIHESAAGRAGETAGSMVDLAVLALATAKAGDAIRGTSGLAITPMRLAVAGGAQYGPFKPTNKADEKNFYASRAKEGAIGVVSGYMVGTLSKWLFPKGWQTSEIKREITAMRKAVPYLSNFLPIFCQFFANFGKSCKDRVITRRPIAQLCSTIL